MGNCSSCFKDKKEYNDRLITYKYCEKCNVTYLSNYEYNRHIPTCNRVYGDI